MRRYNPDHDKKGNIRIYDHPTDSYKPSELSKPHIGKCYGTSVIKFEDIVTLNSWITPVTKDVEKLDDIPMEPVTSDIPDDIFKLIAEYGPCKWYTLSKKFNKMATDILLNSEYIEEVWNSGDILYSAALYNKPDIVNFFLRNEYQIMSTHSQRDYVISDDVFRRILQYEHYVPQLTIVEVNQFLYHLPDEILSVIDVANLPPVHVNKCYVADDEDPNMLSPCSIIESHTGDIISKVFSNKKLPEPYNTLVSLVNHLLYGTNFAGFVSVVAEDRIMIVTLLTLKQVLMSKELDKCSVDDRACNLIKVHLDNIDEHLLVGFYAISIYSNLHKLFELLKTKQQRAAVIAYISIIEENRFNICDTSHLKFMKNNRVIDDIRSYILSSTDFNYLDDNSSIWHAVNDNTYDLFLHMVKHGLSAGIQSGLALTLLSNILETNPRIIELVDLVKSMSPETPYQPQYQIFAHDHVYYDG